jgi:hypothetical protein
MVTGEAERLKVVDALREGARNYVVKPFTADTLRRKVQAVAMSVRASRRPPVDGAASAAAAAIGAGDGGPFLAGLPSALVTELARSADISIFPDGATILEAGDPIESFLFLVEGCAEAREHATAPPVAKLERGHCICGMAFATRERAPMAVFAVGEARIASVARERFDELGAEYPEMGRRLLRSAVRETERHSKTEGPGSSSLSGTLGLITLPELLQTLSVSRKSGVLSVTNGKLDGVIYLADGNVEHAETQQQSGLDAALEMLAWDEGTFVLEAYSPPKEKTIDVDTVGILMESARRKDESLRK